MYFTGKGIMNVWIMQNGKFKKMALRVSILAVNNLIFSIGAEQVLLQYPVQHLFANSSISGLHREKEQQNCVKPSREVRSSYWPRLMEAYTHT